jgi:leucyl aminopeptidase
MSDIFVLAGRAAALPITLLVPSAFKRWQKKLSAPHTQWLESNGFTGRAEQLCALPSADGGVERFVYCVADLDDPFAVADLPLRLPEGLYQLDGTGVRARIDSLALGWGLGAYQFTRYKNASRVAARLKLPAAADHMRIQETVSATARVRDLINTPAEDMMPQHLALAVEELAQNHGGQFREIVGEDLLAENFPCIHTVGRASIHLPRLLELHWGSDDRPLVTIVGKGIVFDSGGLDIKPAAGMRQMKKDMGGAAHAIGLASMIMALELPVRLHLMIPAAENAISANSFRPGDIIRTRSGITVEIDNTDAEGRLVLCDALTEASAEKPDLIIDFATLTGAARVAVGTEVAAYFCNDRSVAAELQEAADSVCDPSWQLPLHAGYDNLLKSHVADLQNAASTPFGGAITAALYLQRFVDGKIPWIHFDIMAFNNRSRPGRPVGGEAMGMRATFELLTRRYAEDS